MDVARRSMALGLRAVRTLGGLEVLDRVGLRERTERGLYALTRTTGRTAGAASRTFAASTARARPARTATTERRELFDLTPTDEQRMLTEGFASFAAEVVRPAASEADTAHETPSKLLVQGNELGATMLAIPTELGGVVETRSAVTSVLATEALAHGDPGIAVASFAPASVSTALALWGDADQQATYLTEFTEVASGDDAQPPVAALAVLEPRALFDPFTPAVTARREGGDLVLDGTKSLVPRAGEAELFLVAVAFDGSPPGAGPALVLVESSTAGLGVEAEPAMGLHAAATGRLTLDGVRVPAGNLLADGDPDVYAEMVHRARLGWCAVALGAGQAVLDHVTPYVNEREAFGEPISHRQSVAFAVADVAIELEGMRLATYRAASRADQGRRFARQAAYARTLCATHGMTIGSTGVQLLGGHGYVKEHPVERWYRDLRAIGVMEGALLV